jgi:hypothetical protein
MEAADFFRREILNESVIVSVCGTIWKTSKKSRRERRERERRYGLPLFIF